MIRWQFEINNWNKENAHALAKASYQAQAAAKGITLSPDELTAFDNIATALDAITAAVGVTGNTTCEVSALADVAPNGPFTINFNLYVIPA